jgi:hypothetical protein
MFGDLLGGLANSLFNRSSGGGSDGADYRSTVFTPSINEDQNYSKALKYNQIASKQSINDQTEYLDRTAPLYTSLYTKKAKIDLQKNLADSAKDLYKYAGSNARYWD